MLSIIQEKFQSWIQKKFFLHSRILWPSFRERDIFWCSFGENIGDEENGKWEEFTRPVLIIRKFNKNLLLWVPLSTKIKPENIFYTSITLHWKNISAITSQIRSLDSRRLHKKIWTLDTQDYDKVMADIRVTVFKNFTPSIAEGGVATNVDL